MNKELQIDDLTRGINDDEPAFKGEGQAEQGTAHPGDKCWQDFMAYLEAPADVDGKAGPDLLNVCLDSPRRISEAYGPESIEVEDMYYRLDRDLADSLDDCDIRGRCRSDLVNAIIRSFFENHLSLLAQYRREKKSLFNNYNPESHA